MTTKRYFYGLRASAALLLALGSASCGGEEQPFADKPDRSTTSALSAPFGHHDGITSTADGRHFTWGWACDKDSFDAALTIHFYLDGTYATGTFIGSTTANVDRADLSGVCGGRRQHGFDFFLPKSALAPGTHTIHAYAIDPQGASGNLRLGTPLSFTVVSSGTGGGSNDGGVGGGTASGGEETHGWDPYIKWPCWRPLGSTAPPQGTCPASGAWAIGTTNEDANFTGGGYYDFAPSNMFRFDFNDLPNGRKLIGWAVDKVNNDVFRNRHSFAGLDDTSLHVELSRDVRISLDVALKAFEQHHEGSSGLAKDRIMVGAVGKWNGRDHYVEVVLWRTANYDLCTGACDPSQVYDRRWGDIKYSDGVYFYGPQLDKIPGHTKLPQLNGSMQSIEIKIASLFRGYPGWSDAPSSWSNAFLQGVYIGVEVWGKGRVWIEHKNYRTWTPKP